MHDLFRTKLKNKVESWQLKHPTGASRLRRGC